MTTRHRLVALVILALGSTIALPAAPAAAEPMTVASVLGDEGSLYQLVTGPLDELFPYDPGAIAGSPALALDVIQPNGSRERTLVPGSGGPQLEGAPSIVFENASRRLYAVWESKKTPSVSRLLLASYGPAGWDEPIELSGDISPLQEAPRVLVTRDRFTLKNTAGETTSRGRTVIHVVWREDSFYYTPVILEAGRYIGGNPIVALADLDPTLPDLAAVEIAELMRAPELAAGADVQSAIIGLVSPTSGRLITLEIRLLPGELGFIADVLRGHIIEIGARDKQQVQSLADGLRGHIIEIGNRLNGGVVSHFAEQSRSAVLAGFDADPDSPIESMADGLRGHIIEIGAHLLGGTGRHEGFAKLFEVGHDPTAPVAEGSDTPGVTHLVRLRLVSDRPAPPLDDVAARMFVSEDGESVLVGWVSQGKVFYTESLADAADESGPWTEVTHMSLSESLGLTEAAAILERRVKRQR